MRRLLLALIVVGTPARAEAQEPARVDSVQRRDSLGRYALPAIEVSVTRTESDLSRVPYAVHAVTRQDLDQGRQRLALDEALVAVPGVLAVNRQNYAQDIVLSTRGFGSRTQFGVRGLKILLDGIPQTLPDGQGQLTNLVLDDVDRIEVLRGSASSLYGNASGGVISLWTGRDRPAFVAPSVRVLTGAYGLTKYRGSIDVPIGEAVVSVSGERTSTDGFRTHSSADIRQGRLRVGLPLGRGRTSFTLLAQVADDPWLDDPGAVTAAELVLDSTANPVNVSQPAGRPRGVGKDVSQEQVGLTATHRLSRGGSISATVFGLKRGLSNPIAVTYIEVDRIAYGARVSGSAPFTLGSRSGTLAAGVDGQWLRDDRINENVARTVLTRDQRELVNEVGPFVQVAFSPWQRVTVNAGARYDRVRFEAQDHFLSDGDDSGIRVMAAVSGSGGLALTLRPEIEPYVTVGTSFDTPTTTELGNSETAAGGFNPDLDPQHAVNYEAGLRGFLAGRVRYSAALYRAEVRDELIGFDLVGFPGRRFSRNAGSSRHAGAELGATIVPVSGLKIRAAYTYSRHRFVTYRTATAVMDGKELPGVPAHFLSASGTLSLWKRLWVTVDQSASSSYFTDDPNTVRNARWAATGMRVGSDLDTARWRFSVFAGVANLWNARYAGSVQVNATGGRYFEPAPPRNFSVGAEIGAR